MIRKDNGAVSTRRLLFALSGAVLGLGAPAGLLLLRLRHGELSVRSAIQELHSDRETFIYAAASTTVAFALFGGVLGTMRIGWLSSPRPIP